MSDGKLNGEVALVTGSGAGNGEAIAKKLAAMGASVVVNDIDEEKAESTASDIRSSGAEVLKTVGDATKQTDVKKVAEEAKSEFGGVDILVNNVGLFEAIPFTEMDLEDWNRYMALNLDSMYMYTYEFLSGMIERGSGKIVNISSDAGKSGYSELVAYSAAKHGVVGFTRALAKEVAGDGINVNAVCPGYIKTEMHWDFLEQWAAAAGKSEEEIEEEAIAGIPLGEFGQPEYVAEVVGFLVSPATEWMTGQAVNISGGLETH
ncbi:SDR family oxidoreductase [Candidatus Bipolaricaulota bacterium]|nr:SDR family oxidoreductase [Candidatus Bipolaricaulota bacterium]